MLVGNWLSTWQEKGRHSRELLAKNAGKCALKNEQLPIIVDMMTGIAADLDRLERGKSYTGILIVSAVPRPRTTFVNEVCCYQ